MSLLYDSFNRFQERYPRVGILEHVKDPKGVYALRIANTQTGTEAYFASKGSQKGDQISIHRELLKRMKVRNTPLFIGLGKGYFYKFMVADIERDCWENTRNNGASMVNFTLKAGRSLQQKQNTITRPAVEQMKLL